MPGALAATKNMANEMKRDQVIAVALHPGTTATDLSAPFQKNVKPEKPLTMWEKSSHRPEASAVSPYSFDTPRRRQSRLRAASSLGQPRSISNQPFGPRWHPGPYRACLPHRLFTTEYTAGMLLDVLEGLAPEDSGGFFAYDGSEIEW